MRKNYILRTALSWLVLLCGLLPAWGAAGEYTYTGNGTFKQITSVDDVTEGYYVLVVADKAMSKTLDGSKLLGSTIVVGESGIENPDPSNVWKFEKSEAIYYISDADGKYLKGKSGKSDVLNTGAIGEDLSKCEITYTDNAFKIIIQSVARPLVWSTANSCFRFYAASNYNTTTFPAPQLYKLDESIPPLTEATISFDGISETLEKNLAVGSYSSVATTNSTATISYSSSNPEVAEIDAAGKVTLKAGGVTTITASVAQNDAYTAAEVSYALTVIDNSDPQLTFENEAIVAGGEYTIDVSEGSLDSKATSKAGSTGVITYASSVEEVAMIDENTGEVLLVSEGETIISATIAATADGFKTSTIQYTLKVTDTTIRETVIFNKNNSSWSKVSGSSYDDCTGNQILVGSDGREYEWNFTQTYVNGGNLQMRKTSGKLVSPTIRTQYGFDFIITVEGSNAAKIVESSGDTETSGTGTVTLRVESPESVVTISVPGNYVQISEIKIVPIDPTQKETPTITIEGVDEDGLLSIPYKKDGEYTIVATTTNSDTDAVITYSTTDIAEEVILLDEETGYMLFVAPGTTTITASVNETENFKAATTSFTLELVDPADIKTFVKVTDGRIGYGEYMLVGIDGDRLYAMSSENTGSYFPGVDVAAKADSEISIVGEENLIWYLAVESDGYWSIKNVQGEKNIYAGYNSSGNDAHALDLYDDKSSWVITPNEGKETFSIVNVPTIGTVDKDGKSTARYLQYNSGSDKFACYKGTQPDFMLYRLETHCTPEGGEQAYTGSYVKTFSMVSQLWSNGKFVLKLHPAETHNIYFDYTAPFYGTSFPLLKGEENVAISTDRHIADEGAINPGYLYIDWNDDGVFDPVTELVAQGESADAMPTFNVNAPDATAMGLHRARFEVDTDNTTPCELNDLENNIAKGSVVVDFDINYFYEVPQEPDPNNPTDIEEVEENVVLYYSNGNIYTNVEGEVAIYDLSGKLVRHALVAPVAVDDLAGGVYIVRVGDKIVKFVK